MVLKRPSRFQAKTNSPEEQNCYFNIRNTDKMFSVFVSKRIRNSDSLQTLFIFKPNELSEGQKIQMNPLRLLQSEKI